LLREFNTVLNLSQDIDDVASDATLDTGEKVRRMLALAQEIQAVTARVLPG